MVQPRPTSPTLQRDSVLPSPAKPSRGNTSSDASQYNAPTSPTALPRTIGVMPRLAANLQYLACAASSSTSTVAKSFVLDPILREASAVLQIARELGPTSDPQRMMPAESQMTSLMNALPNGAQGMSTHAVRYLVAACRCPATKAAFYLEQAVAINSVVASVELAVCLLYGLGTRPDVPRALQLLDDGVSACHPGAMFVVGKCLRDGLGVPADLPTSVVWLERAAAFDYVPACHELGEMYEEGVAPTTPPPTAINEEDDSEGIVVPSDGGVTGGIARNLALATRYYKMAALKGYPPSQLNLAKLFMLGMGTIDPPAATTQPAGDDSMTRSLGECQMKALLWLKRAADLGNTEAKTLLARMVPVEPTPEADGSSSTSVRASTPPIQSSIVAGGPSRVAKALKVATPPTESSAGSSPQRHRLGASH